MILQPSFWMAFLFYDAFVEMTEKEGYDETKGGESHGSEENR